MEIGVRNTGARGRRDASLGQQFSDAGLGPARGLWIAQFDQTTREGAQAVQHAADLALRAIQAGTSRPVLVALLLVARSAIITTLVTLLATVVLARSAIVTTRATIIVARTTVVTALAVTRAAVVTTLAIARATIITTLAIARAAVITTLAITRSAVIASLVVTRSGDVASRHLGNRGSGGGDIFRATGHDRRAGRLGGAVDRLVDNIAGLAISQRLAIRSAIAAATATTTTTTLALLAAFTGLLAEGDGIVAVFWAVFAVILVTLGRRC